MAKSAHTAGPWRQGVTLPTPQTRRWTADQISENNQRERKLVFANFSAIDSGRSRQLIAEFEREEDARFASAAPDLLDAVYAALPFVEDALNDPSYKAGAVAGYLKQMHAAIAKAEGSATINPNPTTAIKGQE